MAGNLIKYYEQQILQLTAEERMELASEVIPNIVSDGNGGLRWDGKTTLLFLALCARAGIGSSRPMNASETALADYLSRERLSSLPENTLATLIDSIELDDSAEALVKMTALMGQDVAMDVFRYILCWACADDLVEPEVEDRLESGFGMNLLVDFGDSGLESVPMPKVQLMGLEAEIALLLKNDDEVIFLRDIQAHFPDRSESEVKRALDCLCEKGVLSCVPTAVGDMYIL